MPELPEVETIRRILKPSLIEQKIINVELFEAKSLKTPFDINELKDEIVIDVLRKGKLLVISLSHYYITLHLRMEGKIFYEDKISQNYPLISFTFYNNKKLNFYDHRKFATVKIFSKKEFNSESKLPEWVSMGPEPYDLNIDSFNSIISVKKRNIKAILLDQHIVSGLGNIYVNEILYASKISPKRLGIDVTKNEVRTIVENSIKILNEAIKQKGSSISTYKASKEVAGEYQNFLRVHKKSFSPNNNPVTFEKVAGRGTYWVPLEQK